MLPDRLNAGFLRHARAVPLAADDDTLVLAAADPLDPFTAAAVAVATGRQVRLEVAVPIELEAALNRLYPEADEAPARPRGLDTPLEEDAERLKDLASEAPVIRLVNQLITRAVETQASDIHIEPFEDRLRVRYRYDGVLHEAETPPRAAGRGHHLAHQDHGAGWTSPSGGCRRTAASSWRCAARTSISASPPCRRCMARRVVLRILDRDRRRVRLRAAWAWRRR